MHNQISKQTVFSLKHQVIRDLAWSLWGPALLIHSAPYGEIENRQSPFPIDESWLQQLDKQPEPLLTYLKQKNTHLLGTYFEALWQFYFSHHPSFKHCICNLQVFDDNKTLGEFDVLVTNQQNQNFHIELTCKFYLEWQDSQCNTLWLGPNCKDRLDIKFHKTSSHQLPLFNTEMGQKAHKQQATNSLPSQQFAIWRGNVFPSNCWLRIQELNNHPTLDAERNNQNRLWFLAAKSLWLSPVIQERKKLLTYEQMQQQVTAHFDEKNIGNKPHALMLISLDYNTENQQWQQQQCFFIMPNNWPYGALAESALTPLRPCKPPL